MAYAVSLGSRSNHTDQLSAHQAWPCLRVLAFASSLCPGVLCAHRILSRYLGLCSDVTSQGSTITKDDSSPPFPCPCFFHSTHHYQKIKPSVLVTPPPSEQQLPESRTQDCPFHCCAQLLPRTVPDTQQVFRDHVLATWEMGWRR